MVATTALIPQNIRICQDETVTWKFDSDEIHTAAFMNPDEPFPPFLAPIPGGPVKTMISPG